MILPGSIADLSGISPMIHLPAYQTAWIAPWDEIDPLSISWIF
jgi:hypothetical protein